MATIIRGNTPISSTTELLEIRPFLDNYWLDGNKERMFLLPFWELQQMLAVSNSNQVALRVTNITKPDNVYTSWLVWEESMSDSLRDPVESGIYYFLFDDNLFNGPIFANDGSGVVRLQGLKDINNTPKSNALWARLGKDIDEDGEASYFAYFLAASVTIIGPGGGGTGLLSGARVPRKKRQ